MTTEKFGEKTWYEELRTMAELIGKLEENGETVRLGSARGFNEALIGTRVVVARTWAIKKKPPRNQRIARAEPKQTRISFRSHQL